MAKKEHIIRTSFSDKQWDDVVYLVDQLRVDTPHELVRALVRDRAEDKRGENMRYGKTPTVPRETKQDKIARLDALSDEDLTDELNRLGVLANFVGEGDTAFISRDEAGRRILRTTGPSGGSEKPFAMFMGEAKKFL